MTERYTPPGQRSKGGGGEEGRLKTNPTSEINSGKISATRNRKKNHTFTFILTKLRLFKCHYSKLTWPIAVLCVKHQGVDPPLQHRQPISFQDTY